MTRWLVISVVVSGLLGGSWVVMGQDPVGSTFREPRPVFAGDEQSQPVDFQPMPPADKKLEKGSGDVPDPTKLDPVWQQIFAHKNAKGALNTKFPNVSLRGRVLSREKPAMAIIEIDGKTFIVGKDSLLTSASMVMKIVELNGSEVRIEISPSNEIIVLR